MPWLGLLLVLLLSGCEDEPPRAAPVETSRDLSAELQEALSHFKVSEGRVTYYEAAPLYGIHVFQNAPVHVSCDATGVGVTLADQEITLVRGHIDRNECAGLIDTATKHFR